MMYSEGCKVLILASSVDPDEMQHNDAAFHLGSSLFAKVPVKGFPGYKGLMATEKCLDVRLWTSQILSEVLLFCLI